MTIVGIQFVLVLAGGVLLVFLAAMFGPYIRHKPVSQTYARMFSARRFYGDGPGNERVAYVRDNGEALLYRLRMIEAARREVILSTFEFHADHTGKDVLAALLCAADRGVEIKLIVDGISGFFDMRNDPYFQALAAQKTVSVKIYNPVSLLRPWRLPARLHDKYLLVDGSQYLLGGRNTFDLFLGDRSGKQNIDRELFVYETVQGGQNSAREMRTYFEAVWGLQESRPFSGRADARPAAALAQLRARYDSLRERYPAAYTDWDLERLTVPAGRISLLSNPIQAENKEPWIWYALCRLMGDGRQVTVYTPYLICGREMYAGLAALTARGVQVDCIINDAASGANPFGCADYLNQKRNIWKTGVKVYEYMGPHSSHTKAVVVDRRLSILGSYNFDMRSTYQDTELMLAVDSPALNGMIRREAEADQTFSRVRNSKGVYEYGVNYVPRRLTAGKCFFYSFMRLVMLLLRRFL